MDLTQKEWELIEVCILKEMGQFKLDLVTDQYTIGSNERFYRKKVDFVKELEELYEKISFENNDNEDGENLR